MDRVVSARYPYVPVRLVVDQQVIEVEAFLDTGFDGDIVIPRGLIDSSARPTSYLYWALTDNSIVQAPAYPGTAAIGQLGSFPVLVTMLGDEPIVGRRVTDRFRVTLDHGRRLVIER